VFRRAKLNLEVIDSGNYTVDYDRGTVTFAEEYTDINTGDNLWFEYVPMSAKDLEMIYAARKLYEVHLLSTGADERERRIEQLDREAQRILYAINSKTPLSAVPDYGYRGRQHFVSM
ncbi:MAG: hypothetical protein PHZ19_09440, partial [Candidatus Thermoplasmatota archaeon]|nr:hypothetical protein [Candidatus Thermoplasmatota archaeon]